MIIKRLKLKYMNELSKEPKGNEVEKSALNFSVHTYSIIDEDGPVYVHWSEGLKMIIVKDGVTLKLNSEEIKQLVKALPRTLGGSY